MYQTESTITLVTIHIHEMNSVYFSHPVIRSKFTWILHSATTLCMYSYYVFVYVENTNLICSVSLLFDCRFVFFPPPSMLLFSIHKNNVFVRMHKMSKWQHRMKKFDRSSEQCPQLNINWELSHLGIHYMCLCESLFMWDVHLFQ